MQRIISLETFENGGRPPLQSWDMPTPPEGFALVPDGFDASAFQEYMGFVTLEVLAGVVTAMHGDQAALDAYRAGLPAPGATAEEVRQERDRLLAETDKYAVLDAPISAESRAAVYAYRQALRDVPEQEGFPAQVVWPTFPTIVKADPDPVDEAVDVLLGGGDENA